MKKLYFFIFLFSLVSFQVKSQLNIETINIDSNGLFSNLKILNKYLTNAQIISLGEQTHLDGATLDAKVQLVKYLHEQLGFNVLAFESGYYECSEANKLLSNHQQDILKNAVFGIWNTKALNHLENYILQTQNTPHPLQVTGFDFQFSGQLAKKYLINDLEEVLKKLGDTSILLSAKWNPFSIATAKQIRYSNYFKKPNREDTAIIGETIRSILNFFVIIKEKPNTNIQLINKWETVCYNLIADTKHRFQNKNYRDSIMAENLLKLKDKEFSGEKIICWNATSHFIYNPTFIDEKLYKEFVPMGEYLHKKLGNNLYTIGFTSFEGKAGSVIKYKLKSPPENSIESIFAKSDIDYGFIDFNSQKSGNRNPFNEIQSTRMLGNQFMQMPLNKVINGLFYIKDAYPSK